MAEQQKLFPGAVLLGPMPGVDHKKFYIIVGVSGDRICVCSVIINSQINQFIMKRPQLLERQLELTPENYRFLSHTSYINCAQPLKGNSTNFLNAAYKSVGALTTEDLRTVQTEVVKSGMLTAEEIEMFQL